MATSKKPIAPAAPTDAQKAALATWLFLTTNKKFVKKRKGKLHIPTNANLAWGDYKIIEANAKRLQPMFADLLKPFRPVPVSTPWDYFIGVQNTFFKIMTKDYGTNHHHKIHKAGSGDEDNPYDDQTSPCPSTSDAIGGLSFDWNQPLTSKSAKKKPAKKTAKKKTRNIAQKKK